MPPSIAYDENRKETPSVAWETVMGQAYPFSTQKKGVYGSQTYCS